MAGGWDGDSLWPKARSFISKASAFVIGAVISATNRLLTEAGHPRDAAVYYFNQTTVNWDDNGVSRLSHDADTYGKVGMRGVVLHAAAAGDGALRIYDQTTGDACTPEITIPQNATTIVDADVTLPEGASGDVILRVETKSGQDTKAIRWYDGGSLREVRA